MKTTICIFAVALALVLGAGSALARAKEPDRSCLCRRLYKLGEAHSARSLDELKGFLKHSDRHVRRTAAHALGKIGDRRAGVELLRLALSPGEDPMVRRCAVAALGKLRDSRALDPLRELARQARGRPLRQACALALERLATSEVSSAR